MHKAWNLATWQRTFICSIQGEAPARCITSSVANPSDTFGTAENWAVGPCCHLYDEAMMGQVCQSTSPERQRVSQLEEVASTSHTPGCLMCSLPFLQQWLCCAAGREPRSLSARLPLPYRCRRAVAGPRPESRCRDPTQAGLHIHAMCSAVDSAGLGLRVP